MGGGREATSVPLSGESPLSPWSMKHTSPHTFQMLTSPSGLNAGGSFIAPDPASECFPLNS